MDDRGSLQLDFRCRSLVGVTAVLVTAIGVLVLVGWIFGIETLISRPPGIQPYAV